MKTTVELPDDLVVEAKKRAAEMRQPLRVLLEAGLRSQLAQLGRRGEDSRIQVRWLVVDGTLSEGLDLDNRAAVYERLGRTR